MPASRHFSMRVFKILVLSQCLKKHRWLIHSERTSILRDEPILKQIWKSSAQHWSWRNSLLSSLFTIFATISVARFWIWFLNNKRRFLKKSDRFQKKLSEKKSGNFVTTATIVAPPVGPVIKLNFETSKDNWRFFRFFNLTDF